MKYIVCSLIFVLVLMFVVLVVVNMFVDNVVWSVKLVKMVVLLLVCMVYLGWVMLSGELLLMEGVFKVFGMLLVGVVLGVVVGGY